MFHIGDLVQYGNSGVCRVKEILQNGMGPLKDRSYYLLVPLQNGGGKIYTPVDNDKVIMRRILTPEEIDELVRQIPDIPALGISDERSREQCYKEALHSCNCVEWIKIIKTLHQRKQKRASQGKKATSTDERYMKNAEDKLYGEFAVALGREKEDVKSYIAGFFEKEYA